MRFARPAALAAGLAVLCSPVALAAPLPGERDAETIVVARNEPRDAEAAFLRMYYDPALLVETATRAPKPLDQIAENVTVVTAAQIRDMNAHTLGDVLRRVPGVYVETFGNHFGSTPLAHIQGSGEPNGFRYGVDDRHVLVLLDGIPWSSETAGPFLDTLPVGPVERIEIVKGPASSTWGSSLGGVINIITKQAGESGRTRGAVRGSYGEREAWDARAELAGGAGPVGYYLQGQRQHADWDHPGPAGYDQASGLAKVRVDLGRTATLHLSAGHVDAEIDHGRIPDQFAFSQQEPWAAFGRVGVDARPGPDLGLHLEAYRFEQRVVQPTQEDGTYAPAGDLLVDQVYDEEHTGVQARADWIRGRHTVVAGADFRHTAYHNRVDAGDFFQSLGSPPRFQVDAEADRWGVYVNDTARFGPLTLIPGVRYDDGSRIDPFTSPSLGATWALGGGTLLRADVARGFSAPPLSFLTGGAADFVPNPDLDPEEIGSYQAGVETTAVPHLWLKLTGFRHEVSGLIRVVPTGTGTSTWVNRGTSWRTGYELEAETASFAGLRARGAFSYVQIETSGRDRDQDQHQALLGLSYDPDPTLYAEVFGHYVWWDVGPGAEEGRHNDMLWNLNLRKTVALSQRLSADLFATVHNLFNGDQELDTGRGQEGRWVEAGVRVEF